MRHLLWLLIFTIMCVPVQGQGYRLFIWGPPTFQYKATAVCFEVSDAGSYLVTAKHNLPGSWGMFVWADGRWIPAILEKTHPTDDIAVLFVPDVKLRFAELAEAQVNQPVRVAGFGPEYNRTRDPLAFDGVVTEPGTLRGTDGEAVIVGDSGGLVGQNGKLVGIISGHTGPPETGVSRKPRNGRVVYTVFTSANHVAQCVPVTKPILVIIGSKHCSPCRQFDREFRTDPLFRAAICSTFDTRYLSGDMPEHQATIRAMGISMYPAFVVEKDGIRRSPVYGFQPDRRGKAAFLSSVQANARLEMPPPPAGVDDPEVAPVPPTVPPKPAEVPSTIPKPVPDSTVPGPAGERGDKGPTGDKGLTGDKGPTGDRGPAGDKGPTGDRGPSGLPAARADIEKVVREVVRTELASVAGQPGGSGSVPGPPTSGGDLSWPADDTYTGPPASRGPPEEPTGGRGFGSRVIGAGKKILGVGIGPAIAIATGSAVTGGIGVPLAIGLYRMIKRRRASRASVPQRASGEQKAEASEYVVPRLPEQAIDYSTAWAEHWVAQGLNPQHEAEKLGMYVDAIRAVDKGELVLPGVLNPRTFASSVTAWVNKQFVTKIGITPRPENFNHKAFFGFLHRRIVDNIRQGLFAEVAPNPSAADVLEDFVNRKIVNKFGVT